MRQMRNADVQLDRYGQRLERRAERRARRDLRRQVGFRHQSVMDGVAGARGAAASPQMAAGIRAVGSAASWTNRRLTHLRHNLLSYRTLLVGGVAAMAGRSFIDATIGSADDIQRSRLLLQASLGDARKVESAFDAAIDLAREIGPLTRQEALQSMRFMVPLAGGNVGEAAELTRLAKALQVTNPEQDFGGALFSLRELIGSGQVRSLRERFNISGLPTRTEAEALARERGQTTAQVYMTEFRARLQALYGQGGQDAVTALLDADTSTVRGQVTMLATIFQDALADIGSDPQGRLNERLEDTIDRARAYVESKDFQDLSSRISEGMVGGVDRFLDFLESNPIERAEAFMDKWGGVILTIAKLYGINVLTGGAVTSLGGGALRMMGRGGRRTAGTGIGMLPSIARGGRLASTTTGAAAYSAQFAGGTAAAGAGMVTLAGAVVTAGAAVAGALALGLWRLTHLESAIVSLEKTIDPDKAEREPVYETFSREEIREARDQGAIFSLMRTPGMIGRSVTVDGRPTASGLATRGDILHTVGRTLGLFDNPEGRFTADDESTFNTFRDQMRSEFGLDVTGYREGGRVSRLGFEGGYKTEEEQAIVSGMVDLRSGLAEGGLSQWFDSASTLVRARNQDQIAPMMAALNRMADRNEASLAMAESFNAAMEDDGLRVVITRVSSEVQHMQERTEGSGVFGLLGTLGE